MSKQQEALSKNKKHVVVILINDKRKRVKTIKKSLRDYRLKNLTKQGSINKWR